MGEKEKGERVIMAEKRAVVLFLALALAMSAVGCGKEKGSVQPVATEQAVQATEIVEVTSEPQITEEPIEATQEPVAEATDSANQETEEPGISIYYGDDNAEKILSEKIPEQEITPELLVQELVKRNILEEGTKVNSLKQTESAGEKTLEVDFSQEFQITLFNQGTAGEFIMMGSVVDTFLKAYDAQKITITVDGNVLESGHCIYEAPMGYYEPNEEANTDQVISDIAEALGVES